MPSEVDRQIASSSALLDRLSEEYRHGPARRGRVGETGRRLTRVALAEAALLVAALAFALLVGPIGLLGGVALFALMLVAAVVLLSIQTAPPPTPERLREAPLKALPDQTARWLAAQRPALPAPAIGLVDQIGRRLDALTPQLATLDEREPAAVEVRKLVGEQLPEFLKGYQRVPASLRGVERNGKTPDAELVQGLEVIERQLAGMSQELAQGDLDGLATRGRFLEIKYQGEPGD